MAGVSRRDADAISQAVLQVATLRRGVDVNDFERALARFMAQHLAPGSQPDAAMFNAMLRLLFDFGITMPAEWSTFFRALIVLEGTLTTIAPGYSVIDAAESIAASGCAVSSPRTRCSRRCATSCCARCRCSDGSRATSTARSRSLERDGLRVRVSHFSDEHDERVVTTHGEPLRARRSSPGRSVSSRSV